MPTTVILDRAVSVIRAPRPGWLYSPGAPAAPADNLPWLQRPKAAAAPDPEPVIPRAVPQLDLAGGYGGDHLPWLKHASPAAATADDVLTRSAPQLFLAGGYGGDFTPWRPKPLPAPVPTDDVLTARAPQLLVAGGYGGDYAAWRFRPAGAADVSPELPMPGRMMFLFSPQPSYAEYLPWRGKPAADAATGGESPRVPFPAGVFTASAGPVADNLPWRFTARAEPAAIGDGPPSRSLPQLYVRGGYGGDSAPWRHAPADASGPDVLPVFARGWFAGMVAQTQVLVDYLPWHSPVRTDVPASVESLQLRTAPQLYARGGYGGELLAWRRPSAETPAVRAEVARAPGWTPALAAAVVSTVDQMPWHPRFAGELTAPIGLAVPPAFAPWLSPQVPPPVPPPSPPAREIYVTVQMSLAMAATLSMPEETAPWVIAATVTLTTALSAKVVLE